MARDKEAVDGKVVFITGTSSGFGFLTAKQLARDGHVVYATMRDIQSRNKDAKDELEAFGGDVEGNIHVLEVDVLKDDQVRAAVQAMIAAEGRIDVLVNNAGYGLIGPVESASDEAILHQFDTNVFGYIRTIRAVLPHMRDQRSGHIINVSSVAGRLGIPMEGLYCATKFAVEGLSESLVGECYLFDIKVTVIEPHTFKTDFLKGSLKPVSDPGRTGEYEGVFKYFLDNMENFASDKSDPQQVADKISSVIGKRKPPFRAPVGPHARRDSFFAKLLSPLRLQKIASKMYGMKELFEKIPKSESGNDI
ncbi:SDR family NAD(P)-dependent oxidoreductase [Candidatus Bathyarchaeota archaeon]|nr:SDR family NAD(P)-dependent oxidoreductase [Candidatus Bathyarchaeota archaeon]